MSGETYKRFIQRFRVVTARETRVCQKGLWKTS